MSRVFRHAIFLKPKSSHFVGGENVCFISGSDYVVFLCISIYPF
jgi:hypothetical protein